jgi:acetolactate synthase-1/2/3 large subunit
MIKKYKVTDLIAEILAQNGVKVVFGVSGGAALHIINSIDKHVNIKLLTTHHEQAAAMAADSVGRITNNLGVAVATSGPGATNLITGIAGAFYDSVPVLFITGQVSTTRLSGASGVRQMGFQETPVVEIVKPVTKYAVQVKKPEDVMPELQKCIKIATSGRKGPVLIDVPDDIQRMQIEIDALDQIILPDFEQNSTSLREVTNLEWSKLDKLISEAKRPVLVLGWGVHLAGVENMIKEFVSQLQWPVVLTWGAADVLDSNCQYRVGTFGTHGTRSGNFTVQNSDLILSIGSRLDTKSTGSPVKSFARGAKRIMVDIDRAELKKYDNLDWDLDLALQIDLTSDKFIKMLNEILKVSSPASESWHSLVERYKKELVRKSPELNQESIDPYYLIEVLSEACETNTRIIVDTGCTVAWVMQDWKFKKNQRIFHDCNNTAMGWALPASIGSLTIDDQYSTVALIGDGSFMMSMQELSTLKIINKPLKIFLINNSGYSMIKQTQDQWFQSEYFGSNAGNNMAFPNYEKLCAAFGINYSKIDTSMLLTSKITEVLKNSDSVFCEVVIDEKYRVNPQVKFGSPIEEMEPSIQIELQNSLMIL